MGVVGQPLAPAALSPGMARYPLCRRQGGPQGRAGWVLKISPPPGLLIFLYVSCSLLLCTTATFPVSVPSAALPRQFSQLLVVPNTGIQVEAFRCYDRNSTTHITVPSLADLDALSTCAELRGQLSMCTLWNLGNLEGSYD